MAVVKISELEKTTNLNSQCCFPVVSEGVTKKVEFGDFKELLDVPTKTSQLTNDSGFIAKDSEARLKNVVSRNLFNFYEMFSSLLENTGGTVSINGTSITYTSNVVDGYITSEGKMSVTAGKTYTLSLQTSQTSSNQRVFAYFYDSDGNVQYQELGLANQNNTMTFTVPAGMVSMRLRLGVYGAGNQTTFSQIQIEEGSTATDYVPYLDLAKVMPLLPVTLPMGVNEEYVYTSDLSYTVVRIGKIVIVNIRTIAFKSVVPHSSMVIHGLPPAKNSAIFYLYGGNTAKGDTVRLALTTDGDINIHYGSNAYFGVSADAQYGGTIVYETTN